MSMETVEPARSSRGGSAPLLLRALRGEAVERPPVWFMRQAGRSLPEYREVRRGASLMQITHSPELTAKVTLQPVERHGVDAAILFSDIVTPLEAIGIDIEIRPGVGPVIESPVRSAADVARLRPFEPDIDAPWLGEAVRLTCAQLEVPLIGFAGAPFTIASYLVEGGPSKSMGRTKALMRSDPGLWRDLLSRLADIAVSSLTAQVAAGASAVQVFDSWVGALSLRDYEDSVLPVVAEMFARLRRLEVPRVHFGLGTGHLLDAIASYEPDAIGLDWRTPLADARRRLPATVGLQGNLDPAVCLCPAAVLEAETRRVLAEAPRERYVFNLGHGVPPDADPASITHIAELVRAYRYGEGARA
ncbi:MAG TPA: uroporphyrinogen decarboxylase [Solirubrobacteraceae bacterium]|nr:uroporphyrinogen decarboxylase [Solirubrobacteraceae bacterium]